MLPVVLDTNVFVAAGFRSSSASAKLVDALRDGRLLQLWTEATRAETESVLRRIPRLGWTPVAPLFIEAGQRPEVDPDTCAFVEDPADRKFAALALAAGCPLVTSDAHLLDHRERPGLEVVKPSMFWARRMHHSA